MVRGQQTGIADAISASSSNLIDISKELMRQEGRQLTDLTGEGDRLARQVARLEEACVEKEAGLLRLQAEIADRDRSIAERDRRIAALEAAQSGLLWDLLCAYRSIKDRAFPYGSRRRACYDFILECCKVVKWLIRPPAGGKRIYLLRPLYHRLPLSPRHKQYTQSSNWSLDFAPAESVGGDSGAHG